MTDVRRVLMLSNPDSVHTQKWVRALSSRGVEVRLLGLQAPTVIKYDDLPGVRVESVGVPSGATQGSEWSAAKLLYLRGVSRVRAVVQEFRPDVIHAHYLTSYGVVAALANRHPLLTSVWGSDIYENPDRSVLHRAMVRFALRRADRISATSHVMARRTSEFTAKPVAVIPFGIDLAAFVPVARESRDAITVGTVKTLHPKYGVNRLIAAFAEVRRRQPALPLRLLIVGGGPQEAELKALAVRLGVGAVTTFTGAVASSEVAKWHQELDVYVALSTVDSESFGVAVIEAGACGRPVVVSDAGGLPEVVRDGETGFVVPRDDAKAAADAIERLVLDPVLRTRMGDAGRAHVAAHYDLERNLDQMLALYRETAGLS